MPTSSPRHLRARIGSRRWPGAGAGGKLLSLGNSDDHQTLLRHGKCIIPRQAVRAAPGHWRVGSPHPAGISRLPAWRAPSLHPARKCLAVPPGPPPPALNLLRECDASLEDIPVAGARLDIGRVPRAISAHFFFGGGDTQGTEQVCHCGTTVGRKRFKEQSAGFRGLLHPAPCQAVWPEP